MRNEEAISKSSTNTFLVASIKGILKQVQDDDGNRNELSFNSIPLQLIFKAQELFGVGYYFTPIDLQERRVLFRDRPLERLGSFDERRRSPSRT